VFKKKAILLCCTLFAITPALHGQVHLIANSTISGTYEDFASSTSGLLENGVPGNRLGGIGSGFAYAGGTTFLALPDRGPNAQPYNGSIDDTVSYIARFHTFNMSLSPSDPGSSLPFTLTPMLIRTTLLSSPTPLVYGTGVGLGNRIDGSPLGSGAPALNNLNHTHYFTGRSDNFDPARLSTDPNDARLDPEGIRVSSDGRSVFISDEYGPYVYQFDRMTGMRIRSYKLPDNLAITHLFPKKDDEINNNTVGRVTNKGMEGLAITPDGNTLVGIMQANLEQDKKNDLRIVAIDIRTGTTHEYAYHLTSGSGVSEILAVNNHQFLLDERDGTGMADTPLLTDTASAALVKQLFLIDLAGATDVTTVASADLKNYYVPKTLFLDIVAELQSKGFNPYFIPSKIEGIAFGRGVLLDGAKQHTLYVANDNDFLAMIADPLKLPSDSSRSMVPNPNQFYVFAFADTHLPGYIPQRFHHGVTDDRDDALSRRDDR